MKQSVAIVLGCVLVVACAQTTVANLILEELFDYSTGNLVGENGGTGFSEAWRNGGDVGAGLTYTDSNGNELSNSGNGFSVAGSSTAFRGVSSGITSASTGTYWLAYLIEANSSSLVWGGLSLFDNGDGGSENLYTGLSTPNNHRIQRYNPNSSTQTTSGTGTNNETAFLAIKLELSDLANSDTVRMYINPLLDTEPTVDDLSITGDNILFDRIRVAGNDAMSLDAIRFGDTYGDVTPFTAVPEPTAALLLLIGLGAFGLRAWRRNS